jgi:hypothetical protein
VVEAVTHTLTMKRRIVPWLLLAVSLAGACSADSPGEEAAGAVRRACRDFEKLHGEAELLADKAQAAEAQSASPEAADVWDAKFQAALSRQARSAKLASVTDGKWAPVAKALEDAAKASAENEPWSGDDRDRRLAQVVALRNAHAACVGR